MTDLRGLMDEFARETDGDAIEPNADGIYEIAVDGWALSIGEFPEDGSFVLWAEVGETPPEGREAFYRMLLEAMYAGRETGLSRFSIDHATGRVFLHREDPDAPEDLAGLKARLNAFADQLADWRGRISDFRAPSDDGRTPPEGGDGTFGFDASNFIRI